MNLANKLTILRIAAIPVFMLTFYMPFDGWHILAAAIFILAFITDMIDGRIARKYNMVTNFGKLMDPIADKLLTVAALVMLASFERFSPIAVIIILSREFLISGFRAVVAADGVVIAASWLGKAKTVSQFAALCAALLQYVLAFIFTPLIASVFVNILVWGSVALTVWSGVDYLLKNAKYIDHRQ